MLSPLVIPLLLDVTSIIFSATFPGVMADWVFCASFVKPGVTSGSKPLAPVGSASNLLSATSSACISRDVALLSRLDSRAFSVALEVPVFAYSSLRPA